jgi:hypothetical protein
MAERLDLKIIRVGIENEDAPCRISIKAEVSSLSQLRSIADKFRLSKERIPAQLLIGAGAEKHEARDEVRAEQIEQVIIEGLASMQHSGQIAREILRRFRGRCITGV